MGNVYRVINFAVLEHCFISSCVGFVSVAAAKDSNHYNRSEFVHGFMNSVPSDRGILQTTGLLNHRFHLSISFPANQSALDGQFNDVKALDTRTGKWNVKFQKEKHGNHSNNQNALIVKKLSSATFWNKILQIKRLHHKKTTADSGAHFEDGFETKDVDGLSETNDKADLSRQKHRVQYDFGSGEIASVFEYGQDRSRLFKYHINAEDRDRRLELLQFKYEPQENQGVLKHLVKTENILNPSEHRLRKRNTLEFSDFSFSLTERKNWTENGARISEYNSETETLPNLYEKYNRNENINQQHHSKFYTWASTDPNPPTGHRIEKERKPTPLAQHPSESAVDLSDQSEIRSSGEPEVTSEASSILRTILLASDNLTHCLKASNTQDGELTLKALAGFVTFTTPAFDDKHFRLNISTSSYSSYLHCDIQIILPRNTVMQLQYTLINDDCNDFDIRVNDGETKFKKFLSLCDQKSSDTVTIPTNSVWLDLMVSNAIRQSASVMMNFTAIPTPQKPHLKLTYVTPNKGLIQTPDWDSSAEYFPFMDSVVHVPVPQNHVVMVSFPVFYLPGEDSYCSKHLLQLYAGGNTSAYEVLRKCYVPPAPVVYNTTDLFVRLLSEDVTVSAGLKMVFTFHHHNAVPEKLADGQWNCSVRFWNDFKEHFPCNLQTDCPEGEDEVACFYSNDLCRVGDFSMGGKCFRYVRTDASQSLSWNMAASGCYQRKARLVSLSSLDLWDNLTWLLHQYGRHRNVFIGLTTVSPNVHNMYKAMYQWVDRTIAYHIRKPKSDVLDGPGCLYLDATTSPYVYLQSCDKQLPNSDYVCEYVDYRLADRSSKLESEETRKISWPYLTQESSSCLGMGNVTLLTCPSEHVTHSFLAYDARSACWTLDLDLELGKSASCLPHLASSFPPYYACADRVTVISYTMVCDHRPDCSDHSDETFCAFPPCMLKERFNCGDRQCVPLTTRCDGWKDCYSGLDELQCPNEQILYDVIQGLPPPAAVYLDGKGSFSFDFANKTTEGEFSCPETHFQCPDNGYCLPAFLRCNGVYDCSGHQDEESCDDFECPGFYRCRSSYVCLHVLHVCDGIPQCPEQDDELYCHPLCPEECTCLGFSFFCKSRFEAVTYSALRFLDASDSGMTLEDVARNFLLIHLSLARCGIADLKDVPLQNLRSLDLSDNFLSSVSTTFLRQLNNLQTLLLAGNLITMPLVFNSRSKQLPSIQALDLSRISMNTFNASCLDMFPNIRMLNLSFTDVQEIVGQGFQSFQELRVLDLRGCPITFFSADLFQGLDFLQAVKADNYKLCCPAVLPLGFPASRCLAPADEISSCDALLRSDVFRVFLSVFAVLALVGNVGSLGFRFLVLKTQSRMGFGVFVTHLCVADLFMGVYLWIIGVADRVYLGTYLWKDTSWKQSWLCKAAGFLSLLSREVSAFIICLITLERFLVLRFPFRGLHFRKRSAHLASVLAWAVGLVLSAVPLLPTTTHWQFYSQTGFCIALPISRERYPGYNYSVAIFIHLNFCLFFLIALGQGFIYWSIKSNKMSSTDSTRKSKDLTLARRLLAVAVSNFLCWFPVCLLGALATYKEVPIPGEAGIALAIFALPVNSALNPFIYTINVMLERRRLANEERLKERLMGELRLTCETKIYVKKHECDQPRPRVGGGKSLAIGRDSAEREF